MTATPLPPPVGEVANEASRKGATAIGGPPFSPCHSEPVTDVTGVGIRFFSASWGELARSA